TITIFGTVVLLLLLGAVFLFDRDFSSHTQARMAREANRMKSILEWIMLDSADLKRERAASYLSGVANDTFITQLRVFSLDTTVVFSGDEAEVGEHWDLQSAALCVSCHKSPETLAARNRTYADTSGRRFYHFVLPIENRPACLKCHENSGELRAIMVVDFSLAAADSSAAEARLEALGLLGILLLAFVTLIYALLNRAVYQPLVVIAGRLNRIASGDFGGTERDRQSDSSNIIGYIHDQIDTAGRRLNTSYLKLEGQIEARTLSLRESQEALSQERNRLRLLLDSSPQGILEVSVAGGIIFANARIAEMTGAPEERLVGGSMSDFPLLAEVFDGKTLRRARESSELHKIELGAERIGAEDLGDRFFNVQASRVETADGNTALLIMLIDATLERKVEQNLRRQERLSAIGGLAAGVAHEVGNPLSAISSVAQMMKHDPGGERDQTNLDLIAYHIDRINRIVRGLSDLSRDPREDQATTTLSSVIEAAVEIARYDERARAVQFVTSYPDVEREQTVA
ncbi:MAG: histidine kinase dimerization/phospho-acceptor domain-containing protein, partial [Candidatus Zixiibacteriota bacterium]